jgi:hypothetical protein
MLYMLRCILVSFVVLFLIIPTRIAVCHARAGWTPKVEVLYNLT